MSNYVILSTIWYLMKKIPNCKKKQQTQALIILNGFELTINLKFSSISIHGHIFWKATVSPVMSKSSPLNFLCSSYHMFHSKPSWSFLDHLIFNVITPLIIYDQVSNFVFPCMATHLPSRFILVILTHLSTSSSCLDSTRSIFNYLIFLNNCFKI